MSNILYGIFNIEPIEKAGRKISSSNLQKLKEIQELFTDFVNGLVDESENEEENENEITDEGVIFRDIIKDALSPIVKRIERVERARGLSNRISESTNIEKSNSNSFWEGIF